MVHGKNLTLLSAAFDQEVTGNPSRLWLYSFWLHFLCYLGSPMSEVTRILSAIEQGDPHAAEQLLPLVYDELRKLAALKLAQEKPGQTLQATALVHEAYLRLVDTAEAQQWNSRGHFFAAAAEAMRRILVENARRKKTQRHGAELLFVELEECDVPVPARTESFSELDDALELFSRTNPEKAELVNLRYFSGLTIEQTARTLNISVPTANRWWHESRRWLAQEIERSRAFV